MATVIHAPALAAVHLAAMPPGEAWGGEAFAVQLALPGTFGFVDPGGGMVLARAAGGEAEILALAVAPEGRRQGRGARLLAAAEAEAVRRGAEAIYLEVAESNAPARALYERAGYREVGRRRAYYRDGGDALVLARPLSPAGA